MKFTVQGKPFGKARPRRGRFNMYDPKANAEYEQRVRDAYISALGLIPDPIDKPMWLNIVCYYPIPKRTPKKLREAMIAGKVFPTVKPDVDNCAKSVMDALNGYAFVDDKQVVLLHVSKRYSDNPRTVINIGRCYHDVYGDS